MINRLNMDKTYESSNILNSKLKDLLVMGNKRFGEYFEGKINAKGGVGEN